MFALKGAPLSTRIRYHRFGHIACETYKIHKNLSTPPLGKQNGGVRSNTIVLVTYLHVFKIFRRFSKAIGIFGSFFKSVIFQWGHFSSKIGQKGCTLRFFILCSCAAWYRFFCTQYDTDFQKCHFSKVSFFIKNYQFVIKDAPRVVMWAQL